jgi:hypothetical protein
MGVGIRVPTDSIEGELETFGTRMAQRGFYFPAQKTRTHTTDFTMKRATNNVGERDLFFGSKTAYLDYIKTRVCIPFHHIKIIVDDVKAAQDSAGVIWTTVEGHYEY